MKTGQHWWGVTYVLYCDRQNFIFIGVCPYVCVQVIARRKEDSGKVKVLLHWTPEDM